MKKFFLLLLAFLFSFSVRAEKIYLLKINGIIDNAIADYVNKSIEQAEKKGALALVITLDTPGGVLQATKEIVKKFFASKIPIVVYVYPKGASATSAGMMVTIGAHIAIMAPGTNIGAAHPVLMPFMVQYQPVPENDVMMKKATQDTAGWVRSIAQERGRNADWVVKAVKESSSITAHEALKLGVIDGIVEDLDHLLDFLDGKKVKLSKEKTIILHTKDARLEELKMTLAQSLQHIINNPNVILILLLIGALGIAVELKAPGMIFPGVIGAACILVALLAPNLPINYIGLVLIVVGVALLIAEIFIVSHGLLSIFGIGFLIYGSLMLFETQRSWNVRVSWSVILPLVAFVAFFILIIGERVWRAHRAKVQIGYEELKGMEGEAITDLNPKGKVFIHGEYWEAESINGEIKAGEKIIVENADRFILKVKKLN